MKTIPSRTDLCSPRIALGTRQPDSDPGATDKRVAAIRPAADSGITRDASPEWIPAGTDPSLRALGTDYLPLHQLHQLHQLHRPDPTTPFADPADELAEPPADGKIHRVRLSALTAIPGGESCCSTC